MVAELELRYRRIVSGLMSKTLRGGISWEKTDDPWSSGEGYDASLARSSFQLRLEPKSSKVVLSVIDDDGLPIATLVGATLDSPDPIAELFRTVQDRRNRVVLRRLDKVLAEIEAADEPPF